MICYFDTKDLINILEHSQPIAAPDLESALSRGGHKLAISVYTVMELAAPLWNGAESHQVWQMLGYLQDLPLTYVHSSGIPRLELQEAIDAYTGQREYRDVVCFVDRFDKTVDLYATPPTTMNIGYSIQECVWDLYSCRSGAENGLDRFGQRLRDRFAQDRATTSKPSLKVNFITTIRGSLRLHKVNLKSVDVNGLGRWIHHDPSRCPAERLGFEVYHKILKNLQDVPENSDLEDFQHVSCIPYVDAITLDRRMRSYVSQAARGLRVPYDERVAEVTDLLKRL